MDKQESNELKKDPDCSNAETAPKPSIGPDQEIKLQPTERAQDNQTNRLEQQMDRSERGMLHSTRVTAAFTGILTLLAGIQAYSFIESERASLYLKDISFIDKDAPSAKSGGIDFIITIRNTGKHIAEISKMNVVPFYGIKKKTLPEIPEYENPLALTAPPIPPDAEDRISATIREPGMPPPIGRDQLIAGVRDGSIPLWVYGFVEYEIGFPWWHSGKIGFCMKFLPVDQRRGQVGDFLICDDPKYTYVR
jgi:hypothetical protein